MREMQDILTWLFVLSRSPMCPSRGPGRGASVPAMPSSRDTIFALSSGRGVAAVAVIRISGPRAGDALQALTGKVSDPRARRCSSPCATGQ